MRQLLAPLRVPVGTVPSLVCGLWFAPILGMERRSNPRVVAGLWAKASRRAPIGQCDARGFTLIEVTIAVALLAVGGAGLASLVLASGRANQFARQADVAQRAAVERLEQLRALAWTSDGAVVPVSDWSSNLALSVPAGTGGPGLGTSPGDTLAESVAGYADFIDADGRWVGSGTTPPVGAAWVRRWSVQALNAPPETLLLQVAVVPAAATDAVTTVASARAVNGAWLMDVRARRAR